MLLATSYLMFCLYPCVTREKVFSRSHVDVRFFFNTDETGHVLIAASDQRTCSQLREVC